MNSNKTKIINYADCNKLISNIVLYLINGKNINPITVNDMGCTFTVIKHEQNKHFNRVISTSLWKSNPNYVYNLSASLLSWKNLRKLHWNDFTLRIYTDISIFLPFRNQENIFTYLDKISQIIVFLLLIKYIDNIPDYKTYIEDSNYSKSEKKKYLDEYINENIEKLNDLLALKWIIMDKNSQMINITKKKENDEKLFVTFIENLPDDLLAKQFLDYVKNNVYYSYIYEHYINGILNINEIFIAYNKFKELNKIENNDNTDRRKQLVDELKTIQNDFVDIIKENNNLVEYMPLINDIADEFYDNFRNEINEMIEILNNDEYFDNFISLLKKFQNYVYTKIETSENFKNLSKKITNMDVDWLQIFERLIEDPQIEIWLYECPWGLNNIEISKKLLSAELDNRYECVHKKTFGSMVRYHPIFDTSVDICIIRNLELLTSEIDKKHYKKWIKTNLTVFGYTFLYNCTVYETVGKICNDRLTKEKMMLSWFNVNKTTSWFKKNNVANNMYKCIFDVFNKKYDLSDLTDKSFKQHINLLSKYLPDTFFNFSYGVDEIILTICLQSQLLLNLNLKTNYSIDYLLNCELYEVNLNSVNSFNEITFKLMGIPIEKNGINYNYDILARLSGLYFLLGTKSYSIFNPTNITSPIYKNNYNDYLQKIKGNVNDLSKVSYDNFIKYISKNDELKFFEEQINIFNNYLEYINTNFNYKIDINKANICLLYINDDGYGLKNMSTNSILNIINDKTTNIFPVYPYKNKSEKMGKEQIIKSSKFYLGKNFDIEKKENQFSKLDSKKMVNFHNKYIKYKYKYLSIKNLLTKQN